ncbi:unnamed protein product [Paramecium pentaurelia]|uniref:Transmembrane protein n=1 Tax=Paramecium pentaurelia TaxID=43138 RepID=A0A8S1WVY6_9CILI|nr:unnamed protein product [Paramecium pentaurelia]
MHKKISLCNGQFKTIRKEQLQCLEHHPQSLFKNIINKLQNHIFSSTAQPQILKKPMFIFQKTILKVKLNHIFGYLQIAFLFLFTDLLDQNMRKVKILPIFIKSI